MHSVIGKEIRNLVYRPLFIDREPVIAKNVTFMHEFFYKNNLTNDQDSNELRSEK